jgi:hypothetical protein
MRGGKREGAGRPKGKKNKRTLAEKEALAASGLSPLDYMLSVLRDEKASQDVRLTAAKAAAPYLHRALKSVEHSGEGGGPIEYEVTLSFE